MSEPVGWFRAVVVDAADPARLAEFWQGVLGVGVVESESDWIQLAPDRGARSSRSSPHPAGAAPPASAPAPTSRSTTWTSPGRGSRRSGAAWSR